MDKSGRALLWVWTVQILVDVQKGKSVYDIHVAVVKVVGLSRDWSLEAWSALGHRQAHSAVPGQRRPRAADQEEWHLDSRHKDARSASRLQILSKASLPPEMHWVCLNNHTVLVNNVFTWAWQLYVCIPSVPGWELYLWNHVSLFKKCPYENCHMNSITFWVLP
jgi:hypothetical protein